MHTYPMKGGFLFLGKHLGLFFGVQQQARQLILNCCYSNKKYIISY